MNTENIADGCHCDPDADRGKQSPYRTSKIASSSFLPGRIPRNDSRFRVAMLSLHSCPFDVPGRRDSGGMNVYVQQLARHLGGFGIFVDIFTLAHGSASAETAKAGQHVRLIHLPVHSRGDKLELYERLPEVIGAIGRLARWEGLRYDLVHSHYWLSGIAGAELAKAWKVPHIVMLHTSARAKNTYLGPGSEPRLREEAEEEVLAWANLIVASSLKEKADLIKLYGVDERKIAVIPCGVDLKMFHPYEKGLARKPLGLNGDFLALYAGRIEPGKGLEALIEAMAAFSSNEHIRLMIVGGDPSQKDGLDKLRRLSGQLSVAGKIDFYGALPQKELPPYYSAADVCVLPSRYETFGMAALEALACGTPVIASNAGAMEEVVRPGTNGFILEKVSPKNIAEIGRRLMEDKGLHRRTSQAARATVQGYGWPAIARQIAGEYHRLAETPSTKYQITNKVK